MSDLLGNVQERQQLAFANPIWRIAQAQDEIFRCCRQLPTGRWLQTVLTVDCYEEPWAWHCAVGFLREPVNLATPQKAGKLWKRIVELQGILFAEWGREEKALAMSLARSLLLGVGDVPSLSWTTASVYDLTFQAWRTLTAEERQNIERKMAELEVVKKFDLTGCIPGREAGLIVPATITGH